MHINFFFPVHQCKKVVCTICILLYSFFGFGSPVKWWKCTDYIALTQRNKLVHRTSRYTACLKIYFRVLFLEQSNLCGTSFASWLSQTDKQTCSIYFKWVEQCTIKLAMLFAMARIISINHFSHHINISSLIQVVNPSFWSELQDLTPSYENQGICKVVKGNS